MAASLFFRVSCIGCESSVSHHGGALGPVELALVTKDESLFCGRYKSAVGSVGVRLVVLLQQPELQQLPPPATAAAGRT